MIETADSTMFVRDGAIFIVCVHAGACGCCHRTTFLFINRSGKTKCVPCDAHLEFAPPDPGDEPSVEQSFSRTIV
jgi:hypothetical protein